MVSVFPYSKNIFLAEDDIRRVSPLPPKFIGGKVVPPFPQSCPGTPRNASPSPSSPVASSKFLFVPPRSVAKRTKSNPMSGEQASSHSGKSPNKAQHNPEGQ